MTRHELPAMKSFSMPVAAAMVFWLVGAMAAHASENPDILWHIVHARCAAKSGGQGTVPCEETNARAGYAVLKDHTGPAQYLLIPTQRVTGMEDPAIIKKDAPDYFAYAWKQTERVNRHLAHPLPMDDMTLAINSAYGRTQNQLHIHVDCIRPDVKVALHWARPRLGTKWVALSLDGHGYRARLLPVLPGARPFQLLATDMADPAGEMGQHTLVIAGMAQADGRPGFVLLDDRIDLQHGDHASGEELQDHTCQIQKFP